MIFSVLQETNLRSFRKVDGRAILKPETIRRLQQSMMAQYPGSSIGIIMNSWIEKQYNRAVESVSLQQLTTERLKKVPTERIYIYDG